MALTDSGQRQSALSKADSEAGLIEAPRFRASARWTNAGANLTGASLVAAELAVKRLEVIRELLPQARTVAMIVNPNYPGAESEMAEVEAAGRVIGPQSQKVIAGDVPALETAFATISQMRVDAVTVGTDGFFITRREQIAALAARYAVPGIYPFPDYPAAGRPRELRRQPRRCVSTSGRLHRTGSQRGQAGRPAHHATGQVRVDHQPQNRESARPHNSAGSARPRRRGDRMRLVDWSP